MVRVQKEVYYLCTSHKVRNSTKRIVTGAGRYTVNREEKHGLYFCGMKNRELKQWRGNRSGERECDRCTSRVSFKGGHSRDCLMGMTLPGRETTTRIKQK